MSAGAPDRPSPPRESVGGFHDDRADEEEELIMHLERDQLVAETFRPVARATLGSSAVLGLWALRIFVVLVSAMVIYTFIARLH
ncbi:MAG: hypothetical protein ACYDHN_08700 [Solirubrobacteraceae bacterium]